MFNLIAIILALLIVALFIFAATRPDSFRIERSINIKASPETIFPYLNDFHQWSKWEPWGKMDPASKVTISGEDSGVGAIYEWNGNKEVGQGRIEIIESAPNDKIILKIDFIKPFEGHNTIEFTLVTQGEFTRVTQAMYGHSPFLSKVMCLFFSMDKMVGPKYEEGLAALQGLAEQGTDRGL